MARKFSLRVSIHLTGRLQQQRQRRGDEVLGIGADLAAEPAADLRRDGAHLVLAQPEARWRSRCGSVRRLGRGPDGQPARDRIRRGDDAARSPSASDGNAAARILAFTLIAALAERGVDVAVDASPRAR